MSGQFQLRTAGGAYFASASTYQSSARTASGESTTIFFPRNQSPPNSRNSDGYMYMFWPAPAKPRSAIPYTRLAGSLIAAAFFRNSSSVSAAFRPFAS